MRVGEFVLLGDQLWVVWREHTDGSFQIKSVAPNKSWVDNMQVLPEDCTPITKEVADIMRAV
jgi:hypothetical protein